MVLGTNRQKDIHHWNDSKSDLPNMDIEMILE